MPPEEKHIFRFTCADQKKKFKQYILRENEDDPGFYDFLCEKCEDKIFYFIAPPSKWQAKLHKLIAKRTNSQGSLMLGEDGSDSVTAYPPGLFCLALHLVRRYKQEYGDPAENEIFHEKEKAKLSLKLLKKEKALLEDLTECTTDLGEISGETQRILKQAKLKHLVKQLNIFI